jgi:hypothetical protein
MLFETNSGWTWNRSLTRSVRLITSCFCSAPDIMLMMLITVLLVDPVLVDLQDLPGEVERTITKLDKGYEAMHNQGKDKSAFTEQKLKDLLSKMGDPSLLL